MESESKVLIWDIECTNLDADFGTVLCVGYKWLGEDGVWVMRIDDYSSDPINDKPLIKDFLKVYASADVTVAYNGILFDRPYILAKVLEYGLEVPPNIPMEDPYWMARGLRLSRKSLDNIARVMGLDVQKTPVERKIWKQAAVGRTSALGYVEDHCVKDVLVLEEAYLKLRPLKRTHTRLGVDLGHCRYCNSTRLQSRGRYMSKNKGVGKRVQCMECSGWDTRTEKELEKFKIKEGR